MEYKDDELERLAREGERRLEQHRLEHPEMHTPWDLPYKVVTEDSTRGVKRMRLIWLKDNHPETLDKLMKANVLEEHLKSIETRFMAERERIYTELMANRHLLTRQDVMEAHPEITDQDRFYGMKQCEAEAQERAVHEVIESF